LLYRANNGSTRLDFYLHSTPHDFCCCY
jgi:hypothetical protein